MDSSDGSRPTVLYTDPLWALGGDDEAAFDLERSVFGGRLRLRVGARENGRYRPDSDEFLASCNGCEAMVVHRLRVDERLLAAAGSRLRVVGRLGVGVDNLDLPLLRRHGVCVFNVVDYCVDEVAAHTVALALALERRVVPQHMGLLAGVFDPYRGGVPRRLRDRCAGIVGFGRIGRAVAHRLGLFYGRVIATDPYVSADLMAGYDVEARALDELLEQADAVFLHCPLTPETRGLFNEERLGQMRDGAVLVNCARGGLVDSRALHDALLGGHLAGAAIDVFVPEDPHGDEWYRRILELSPSNVVVTSHRAFLSVESERSLRRRVAEAVRSILLTGELPGTVTRLV